MDNGADVGGVGNVVYRVQERGSNVVPVGAFKRADHDDASAPNLVHARHVAAREPDGLAEDVMAAHATGLGWSAP